MSKEDEALSVGFARAAHLLGVSEKHLRNHYEAYNVPFVRLGSRVLFPIEDLRDWLRNNRPKRVAA
jgi:excisionase family DNA binding protein